MCVLQLNMKEIRGLGFSIEESLLCFQLMALKKVLYIS
jgi:hypothetical protein